VFAIDIANYLILLSCRLAMEHIHIASTMLNDRYSCTSGTTIFSGDYIFLFYCLILTVHPFAVKLCLLLYLILYVMHKIKVKFLQNWYTRDISLLFTGRHMLCSMSVRKCIRFCIPELQSWPEVKNTNMKFMKIQDKNTQISVYCIQHYCK
jgi:hypothetical protein